MAEFKITEARFEIDILQTLALGIFSTSMVFYYYLSKVGVPFEMSFAGTGILFDFYMPAQNWFWFTFGVTLCLASLAIYKTVNYSEEVI